VNKKGLGPWAFFGGQKKAGSPLLILQPTLLCEILLVWSHQACHLTLAQGVISDFFEKKFPLVFQGWVHREFKPNDRQTAMAKASANPAPHPN
jgi:hypothetical protein